jgi:hypothetical protein
MAAGSRMTATALSLSIWRLLAMNPLLIPRSRHIGPRSAPAWPQPSQRLCMTVLRRSARQRAQPRQAPLHGERAASIGPAGEDAEVGARLLERVRLDVGLGGRLLDVVTRRWRRLSERDALAAAATSRMASISSPCRRPVDQSRAGPVIS